MADDSSEDDDNDKNIFGEAGKQAQNWARNFKLKDVGDTLKGLFGN